MKITRLEDLPATLRARARRVRRKLEARGETARRSEVVATGLALKWAHERAPHHRGFYVVERRRNATPGADSHGRD